MATSTTRRHGSGSLIWASVIWAACVPKVAIEGAPCPCPGGYLCCETLAACIPSGATCPDALPQSSNSPCASDGDCPSGELCHGWTVQRQPGGHQPAGPGACRRDCSTGIPCFTGETCELVLHDGAPLTSRDAASVCRLPSSAAGCEATGCSACEPSQLGRTYCHQKAIHACFVGAHPDCGLLCDAAKAQGCGVAGCMDSGGTSCNAGGSSEPCVDFACAACPDPKDPSKYACDGTTRIVGCLVAEYPAGPCEQICKPVALDCPPGTRCVDDDYPRCVSADI